jgi:hypothetical protein
MLEFDCRALRAVQMNPRVRETAELYLPEACRERASGSYQN